MWNRWRDLWGGALAIDLGTSNTVMSVPGEGVVLHEPSVVAVEQGTKKILSGCAVGHLARQMWGRTPDSIEVVRPVADGVVSDFQLCEGMLRYFLRKVQRGAYSARPKALIGVPGCITPVEKQALYSSAQRAGLRQVMLLPECTAAAIGVGLPVLEPLASMVCDIGGGTTEAAVLSLADVVASQSIRTAGDAIDQAIVDYLRRRYSLRIGRNTAEELKLDIGSAAPLDQELSAEVRGVDAVTGLPRKALVTSEEIRDALSEPLEAITTAILSVIDRCSPDLASDLVDHGMVLCGGGALLRGIDRYLTQRTGLPAHVAEEPQVAVARGSAICLQHLDQWKSKIDFSEDDA